MGVFGTFTQGELFDVLKEVAGFEVQWHLIEPTWCGCRWLSVAVVVHFT
jgi:hypothetical protein